MGFCKNCRPKIQAFIRKIDQLLISNMSKAFEVTTLIKHVVDLKIWDSLTYLSKNNFDDKVLLSLRASLNFAISKIFPMLQTSGLDVFALIDLLTRNLADATKENKDTHLIKLASLMTSDLDKRYSTAEYDAAVQAYSLTQK